MARNITITFDDGTSHVYQNAPDTLTPESVQSRAEKDFGKSVVGIDGGFTITATPSGSTITIQSPAIEFKIEDPDNLGSYFYAYEYFNNSTFSSAFSKIGARQILHSNRDYEVAVVYMDEYQNIHTAWTRSRM